MGRFEQLVWLLGKKPGAGGNAFPSAMLLSFYCKLLVFYRWRQKTDSGRKEDVEPGESGPPKRPTKEIKSQRR